MSQDLTEEEKAQLIGIVDGRNWRDYDKEFYRQLISQEVPDHKDLDDGIRRALLLYVSKMVESILQDESLDHSDLPNVMRTALLIGLIQGYELGRKRRSPLIIKSSKPK